MRIFSSIGLNKVFILLGCSSPTIFKHFILFYLDPKVSAVEVAAFFLLYARTIYIQVLCWVVFIFLFHQSVNLKANIFPLSDSWNCSANWIPFLCDILYHATQYCRFKFYLLETLPLCSHCLFASLHNFITIPHVSSYAAWLSTPPSKCRHFRMVFPGSHFLLCAGWRPGWTYLSWHSGEIRSPTCNFLVVALTSSTSASGSRFVHCMHLPSRSPFSSSCHHIIIITSGFPCPYSLPPVTCQFSSILSVAHMSSLFPAHSHLLLSLGQAYQILTWFSRGNLASCLQFYLHPRPWDMACFVTSFFLFKNPIIFLCKLPRVESID